MAEWLVVVVRPAGDGPGSVEWVREELAHVARQCGARVTERSTHRADGKLLFVEFFSDREELPSAWTARAPRYGPFRGLGTGEPNA